MQTLLLLPPAQVLQAQSIGSYQFVAALAQSGQGQGMSFGLQSSRQGCHIDQLLGVLSQVVDKLEGWLVRAVNEVAGVEPVLVAYSLPVRDGPRNCNKFTEEVLPPVLRGDALEDGEKASTGMACGRRKAGQLKYGGT